MTLLDFSGKAIQPGDIVMFTEPGRGRNLPPLRMGEVIKVTKAGVTVIFLNKDRTRVQVKDGFWQEPVEPFRFKEFVETGLRDTDPVSVRYYKDRFIII